MNKSVALLVLALSSFALIQGCSGAGHSEARTKIDSGSQSASGQEVSTPVVNPASADPIENLVGFWKSNDSSREGYLVVYGLYDSTKNENTYYVKGLDPSWIIPSQATVTDFAVPLKAIDTETYTGSFEEKTISESVYKIEVTLRMPKTHNDSLKVEYNLKDYKPSTADKNVWVLKFHSNGVFSRIDSMGFGSTESLGLLRFNAKRTQAYFEALKNKQNHPAKCDFERNNTEPGKLVKVVEDSDYACFETYFREKRGGFNADLLQNKLLPIAIHNRDVRMTKLILNHFKDKQGIASYALIKALIEYQGALYQYDGIGESRAFNKGLLAMQLVEMLVNERGADFRTLAKSDDEDLKTQVLYSIFLSKQLSRYAQLIPLAIQSGLDIVKNKFGTDHSNLTYIEFFYDYELWGESRLALAQALLDAGIDPNAQFADGSGGVISGALQNGDIELLKLLKSRGADFSGYKRRGSDIVQLENSIENDERELNVSYASSVSSQRTLNAHIARLKENLEFVKAQ